VKSSIGTFALGFAAAAVLFALAAAAQAQGTDQAICRDFSEGAVHSHFCMLPPRVKVRISNDQFIRYDPAAEARKAQLRTTERQDPSSSLCPPPYRWTARDGCQK
jgi:hypothetical protein